MLYLGPVVLAVTLGTAALMLRPSDLFTDGGDAKTTGATTPVRRGAAGGVKSNVFHLRRGNHANARSRSSSRPGATRGNELRVVPAVLRWRPDRQAAYYRVKIFKGPAPSGGQMFEAWTFVPRLAPPTTWLDGGRRKRLTPGRYSYRVRTVNRGRPGELVTSGSFVVTRAAHVQD